LAPAILAAAKIRSITAGIRTAAGVGKIASAKFARGGLPKFGTFGGKPHSQNGNTGVFEDGTVINVEENETFAIVNKNARGLLGHLSDINQATGGVPFFARGGIALGSAPSTTPVVSSATLAASAAPGADQSALLARLDVLTEVTANMLTNVNVTLPYSDIETAASDVNTVRVAAEV
jgi:hypothetical protein